MNARVTTYKISKSKWPDLRQTIQDQVSRRVSHNPAVKAGYWMVDEEQHRLTVVVVFENEAAMHAATHTAKQLRELGLQYDASSEAVHEMEVVAAVEGHNFEAPGGH
jgi:hypothetical protein